MDFDVTVAMGDVDHDGRAVLEKMGFDILEPPQAWSADAPSQRTRGLGPIRAHDRR